MSESNVIYHTFQEIEETEKSYHRHLRGNGGGGTFDGMEARVAKLEAAVEHIQKDVTEIKVDIREIKRDARNDFRLLFGSLIVTTLGLAGLMAKGFGWV